MIGYYVHHQGRGHLQRMLSIVDELDASVTVLSSLAPTSGHPWVHLPPDDSGTEFTDPSANGTFHWVPRHHPGLRSRMAMIAEWIRVADPDLVVVDVSVEVATLCRLLGVPTVVVAMRGDRLDRAHRSAYDGASALLAPWAAEFPEPGWPAHWHSKTVHTGAVSRFGGRQPRPAQPSPVTTTATQKADTRRVLALWGAGGTSPTAELADARAATPDWEWRVADGHVDADGVWELLQWADVVVTHAGQNAVAEVADARRPAVVIADDRPHGEQAATAAAVHAAGLSVGLPGWPAAAEWPDLLATARAIGGSGWARWSPPGGAARAARFLADLAVSVRVPSAAS